MKKIDKDDIDMSEVVNQLFEGDCLEYMNKIPDGALLQKSKNNVSSICSACPSRNFFILPHASSRLPAMLNVEHGGDPSKMSRL